MQDGDKRQMFGIVLVLVSNSWEVDRISEFLMFQVNRLCFSIFAGFLVTFTEYYNTDAGLTFLEINLAFLK